MATISCSIGSRYVIVLFGSLRRISDLLGHATDILSRMCLAIMTKSPYMPPKRSSVAKRYDYYDEKVLSSDSAPVSALSTAYFPMRTQKNLVVTYGSQN